MKNNFPVSIIAILIMASLFSVFSSCEKECTETYVWNEYQPIWVSQDSIHPPIRIEAPREINNPGKIYWYAPYLLINESQKGFHVIDNTVPENPAPISFVAIEGNSDVAVSQNILYADSYFDLIAIDISDIQNISEVGRVEMFKEPNYYDPVIQSFVVDYEVIPHEEEIPCNEFGIWGGPEIQLDFATNTLYAGAESNATTGTGGSLARFTIAQQHLYIVDEYGMMIFDLAELTAPEFLHKLELGWGIETIFPYRDKLFIGANNGMHILDATDPAEPQYISTFAHANACDPVFVRDNTAFITLRDGTECETFANQLDIVNIEDLENPELIVSHPMDNPHGLSVTAENLFLCEGSYGFKVFDVTDLQRIPENLLDQLSHFHSLDVIVLNDHLIMVIGEDGLYQFRLNAQGKLDELSRLPILF